MLLQLTWWPQCKYRHSGLQVSFYTTCGLPKPCRALRMASSKPCFIFSSGSAKLTLVSLVYTQDLDVTAGEQVIFKHMQEWTEWTLQLGENLVTLKRQNQKANTYMFICLFVLSGNGIETLKPYSLGYLTDGFICYCQRVFSGSHW